MPQQQGVLVTDTVKTQGLLDEFGVVDSKDVIGGCHNVETLQERDNIPLLRRREGMLCTIGPNVYQWVNNAWTPLSGGTQKVIYDVGDGASNVFELLHNFGTKDLIVTIRENEPPYRIVYPSIELTTLNTLEVKFAKPPDINKYRVIILS